MVDDNKHVRENNSVLQDNYSRVDLCQVAFSLRPFTARNGRRRSQRAVNGSRQRSIMCERGGRSLNL